MRGSGLKLSSDHWMQKIFDAKSARQGGVVRRSLRDVDAVVGRERFVKELQRRGYSAITNGSQVIIFCNQEDIRILTRPKVF